MTRSLLASPLLKPRALMAHCRESSWATCRLGAKRRASGILVAPERRMSSPVITWIAEAVVHSGSGRRETEVTSRFINSSMLICLSSWGEAASSLVAARRLQLEAARRKSMSRRLHLGEGPPLAKPQRIRLARSRGIELQARQSWPYLLIAPRRMGARRLRRFAGSL